MIPARGEKIRTGRNLPERSASSGFTMIELIAAIGILGVMLALAIPSFTNSQAVRAIDNEAREILMSFQTAKWQAAATGVEHRLLFFDRSGAWFYRIEREATAGAWTLLPGSFEKGISTSLAVAVNLPDGLTVVFTPIGYIANFDSAKSSVMLSSAKLQTLGQPSQRTIRLFAGGSLRLDKS